MAELQRFLTNSAIAQRPAKFIGGDIYTRPSFGSNHPLSYTRQGSVVELCRRLGWLDDATYLQSPIADFETLIRVHRRDYVAALRAASERGSVSSAEREKYRFGTMENPIFKGVFERASTTVGGSILAAQIALAGEIAFHPAGGTHHGRPDRASGFCYFNDPVYAILTFLDAGLDRVLYVDIDAHHGDGVFDHFEGDDRVACVSIHEAERWPYTGLIADQSSRSLNIPVPSRVNDSEYALLMEQVVMPFARRFDPQAVVITCGADALAGDPLSHMELSNNALWQAAIDLCAVTPSAVVLGGGGYNPWTTVRCWAGLWGLLSGQELPKDLPQKARELLSGFDSDLVDEDDIEPWWIESLADPVAETEIREGVESLASELRETHALS